MKLTVINDDAINHRQDADMVFIDPMYDMKTNDLIKILDNYDFDHLILMASMRQQMEFFKETDLEFCFDCILDIGSPGKPKGYSMPHYTHRNIVYYRKKEVKSAFNRKLKMRTDVYSNNGYWPTILRAPSNTSTFSYAKNNDAIENILCCFNVSSVIDMFAGSGSTGIASSNLGINCTLIEKDKDTYELMKSNLKFNGISYEEA